MKAKEILECVMYLGLNGEDLTKIEVPSVDDEYTPQNEEWWQNEIGAIPPQPLESGTYIVFFSCYDGLRNAYKRYEEDAEVMDNENCPIYIYKLED